MIFNVMGIGLKLRDTDKAMPIIAQSVEDGVYHYITASARSLSAGVLLPPHVALVATMDEMNLCHESDNVAPELTEGRFANFFLADEYESSNPYPIWLQNRRWDSGSMFNMQDAERVMCLRFYLPSKLPVLPQEGRTWMGNQIKSEEEREMDKRAASGLRVGPFAPQPIPPPLTPGYFCSKPFLIVVVSFLSLLRFNALAVQNGIPEWDPYAAD